MANNKIIANGETLIDLTADTVTAGTMVSGTTAHDRSGASITGTFDPSVYVLKAGDTMSGALNFSTTGKISSTELKVNDRNLLKEFKAHTQYFATNIPANADLKTSTYLNAGRYVCRQTATAATLSNCPTGSAFNMDVDYPISLFNTVPSTWGYILRTITTGDGQQWLQYVTIDGNGTFTWNDWVQLRASTNGGNVIKQIRTNDSNEYQLLFTEVVGRDSDTQLSRTRKNECLYYKPSSGELHLERASGITSNIFAYFIAGNSKIAGTDTGANAGVLRLYGQKQYYAQIADTGNSLTSNRTYKLSNKDGELAILGDDSLDVANRSIEVTGADAARSIRIGTKAGGWAYLTYFANGNHGVYSSGYESDIADSSTYTTSNKWIIRRNSAGNVYVDEWASIGGSQTPVYLNSSGRPVALSTTTGSGTRSTTYTTSGTANYAQRAGITTVSLTYVSKGTANTGKVLFTGLPKPKIEVYFIVQDSATTNYQHCVLKVDTDGQIVVASDISNNSRTFYGSVTYPIA